MSNANNISVDHRPYVNINIKITMSSRKRNDNM